MLNNKFSANVNPVPRRMFAFIFDKIERHIIIIIPPYLESVFEMLLWLLLFLNLYIILYTYCYLQNVKIVLTNSAKNCKKSYSDDSDKLP